MKPKVSVIIPNYNYSQYLGEAVESALNQTYENIEVIVVDDGSTDNSMDVLEGFSGRIRVIRQENSGVCVARNKGIQESRGEYIAFLDADDVWLPEKVASQLELFRTDASLGLVHVGVNEIDQDGNVLRRRLGGLSGKLAYELVRFEREDIVLGGGSGIMVPKRVIEDVGDFDTRMSTSADWDFFFRVCERYPAGFVPLPLLNYRMHGANMHGNVARFEKEMMDAFGRIFHDRNDWDARRCYGNLHRILAGSYFRSRDYRRFMKNAAQSLLRRPEGIVYFLAFPLRISKRGK